MSHVVTLSMILLKLMRHSKLLDTHEVTHEVLETWSSLKQRRAVEQGWFACIRAAGKQQGHVFDTVSNQHVKVTQFELLKAKHVMILSSLMALPGRWKSKVKVSKSVCAPARQ